MGRQSRNQIRRLDHRIELPAPALGEQRWSPTSTALWRESTLARRTPSLAIENKLLLQAVDVSGDIVGGLAGNGLDGLHLTFAFGDDRGDVGVAHGLDV